MVFQRLGRAEYPGPASAWRSAKGGRAPRRRIRRIAARTGQRFFFKTQEGRGNPCLTNGHRLDRNLLVDTPACHQEGQKVATTATCTGPDGVEALEFRGWRASSPARRGPTSSCSTNLRADGREVLSVIKNDEAAQHSGVVLTTSKAEEDVLKSHALHANGYVTKPVDLENSSSSCSDDVLAHRRDPAARHDRWLSAARIADRGQSESASHSRDAGGGTGHAVRYQLRRPARARPDFLTAQSTGVILLDLLLPDSHGLKLSRESMPTRPRCRSSC